MANEWKSELQRMLNAVQQQSLLSLGLIQQQRQALGLPLDENFRNTVRDMWNLRCSFEFLTSLSINSNISFG